MSHWNFGSTREPDSGAGLDIKMVLDRALGLGTTMGRPYGPTGSSVVGSNFSSMSSVFNNGPPFEPASPSVPIFDPFSPSSIGLFNPKDPGGNLPLSNASNHHNHMNQVQNKPMSYGGVNGMPTSPTGFGRSSAHSPTMFNSNSNATSMFPISVFSIEETTGGSGSGDGHQNHYNSSIGSNRPQYNSQGQGRNERERDIFGQVHQPQQQQQQNDKDNGGIRETGIVEKLLHSYGFLQSCERNARLFFHYSQFDGKIEHLRLGDPVEFEMTYDRRTGKPIASAVTKIGPDVQVLLGEERLTGMVTTTIDGGSTEGRNEGRISYENRGECFFLPFAPDDIEGNVVLSSGDTVSFQIATNQRTGNLAARFIRLENQDRPIFYRGILCSHYLDVGTIERADVAKRICFTFSETRILDEISVGDNVEFNIQTKNGKEVACNIKKLPMGTVVFEDLGGERHKGQVLKILDRTNSSPTGSGPGEGSQGRLRYRGPNRQEMEIAFGEKDQKGSFTLRHGDWVEFQIATDRRDKQQKATSIEFDYASFQVSDERREQGIISKVFPDGTGHITCAERDQKMFFRQNELIDFNRRPKIGDDVAFTIAQDSRSPIRQAAIRIQYLTPGSVQFEVTLHKDVTGTVVREPSSPWSQETLEGIIPSLAGLGLPQNLTERLIQGLANNETAEQLVGAGLDVSGEPGVIQYIAGNSWQQETIVFHWKNCKTLRNIRNGTKVVFDIHQVRRNKEILAANIRAATEDDDLKQLLQFTIKSAGMDAPVSPVNGALSGSDPDSLFNDYGESILNKTLSHSDGGSLSNGNASKPDSPRTIWNSSDSGNGTPKYPRYVMKGFIAALKDGFGFIETVAQDGEIFFHSSSLVGDFNALEVGQEVEYVVSSKGNINGKIAADMVKPLPKGTIGRAAVFPEILTGIVVRPVRGANPDQLEYTGLIEGNAGQEYPYGIISMLNKKEVLTAGDTVEFQLDAESKPVNIRPIRKKLRATVEAVKGQYGFLSYEVEDGKKLFFHMSEVKDHSHLNPGDEVEFVIVQNPRNGKSSACSVVKLGESQRPERLLNRLSKMSVDETAPRLIVVRQPHGPDGTRGFHQNRANRKPLTA